MITSAKKAGQLTVTKNGSPASRDKTLWSKTDLSDWADALNQQAKDLSQLTRLLSVAIERLVAASEVLLLENAPEVELGIDLKAEMRRYELMLIQRALRKAQGSQMKAAALLKLKPTTLNTKLKIYAGRVGTSRERAARSLLLL